MKRLSFLLTFLAAVGSLASADTFYTSRTDFLAATSATSTATFDTAAPDAGYTSYGTSATIDGVTFTSPCCVYAFGQNMEYGSWVLNSSTDVVSYTGPGDNNNVPATVVTLPTASTAFGVDLGTYVSGLHSVQITLSDGTVYNLTLNGREMVSNNWFGTTPVFFGVTSTTAITSFSILFTDPVADWVEFDNLTYGDTATPVPEPASMFLFGTGLVGMAGAIRRKLRR